MISDIRSLWAGFFGGVFEVGIWMGVDFGLFGGLGPLGSEDDDMVGVEVKTLMGLGGVC